MLNLKKIEKITNGLIINGNENQMIKIYSTSNTSFHKDIFYIPIIFKGSDNEKNIINAVSNDAIGFMINQNSPNYKKIVKEAKQINPKICILAVENVNHALYELGIKARELNTKKEVIAITGSYGKSTLTDLVSNVLETEMKVLHDFSNENNNTRWHLSRLLQYFENYDIAVLELGTNNFGSMKQMSRLVKPSIAIINSIGTAHINNFKTKENILNEKMHIVDFMKDKKILYINAEDKYLKQVKESKNYKLLNYSLKDAWNMNQTNEGISFSTKIYEKETSFHLNLYGEYFIRNIILAIKIAEMYHIKYENIIKAIKGFKPLHGRFRVLRNKIYNITLIDDTYNSCFETALSGLEISNRLSSKQKIAVLGTIGSGANGKDDTSQVHEQLGEYFQNLKFDYLFLFGNYTKHIFKSSLKYFPQQKIKRFKSKETLLQELIKTINNGDLIYIKDAGFQKFEEIVNQLKDKYNLQ